LNCVFQVQIKKHPLRLNDGSGAAGYRQPVFWGKNDQLGGTGSFYCFELKTRPPAHALGAKAHVPTPKAQELGLPARLPTPSAHMLASSADVLEALACVLEVQADGREDQNRPRNRQNQLDDDLDGPEQQAVDQSVKNPAEQAEKKASAIRADEAPELAQEVNHSPRFCRRRWKAKVFLALR
jgi:hypothetical protein